MSAFNTANSISHPAQLDVPGLQAGLSRSNQELLELMLARPEGRVRASFRELEAPARAWDYTLQPWPTIISKQKLAAWERQSEALSRLFKDVPRRLFGNDPAKLAAFYGLESEFLAAVVIAEPSGIATALSRLDLIATPSGGVQCIEFNSGSYLQGWLVSTLAAAYRQVPLLAEFFERHPGISRQDVLEGLLTSLLHHLSKHPAMRREPSWNVAICVSAGTKDQKIYLNAQDVCNEACARAAEKLGLRLPCSVVVALDTEIVFRQGSAYQGDRRLHAIFEHQDGLTSPALFRCFKAGGVLLYTGPATAFLSDKRNLALLSELEDAGPFSDEERELIRETIPWTRLLTRGPVEYHGSRVPLPDLVLAEQERLVLKRGLSSSGVDVHIGSSTEPERWREVLNAALSSGGWIVQERVETCPFLFQHGEDMVVPHDLIWGLYVFDETASGGFLRTLPCGRGPVNSVRGSEAGVVFEVDEPETDRPGRME